jgi:hypothetical protein
MHVWHKHQCLAESSGTHAIANYFCNKTQAPTQASLQYPRPCTISAAIVGPAWTKYRYTNGHNTSNSWIHSAKVVLHVFNRKWYTHLKALDFAGINLDGAVRIVQQRYKYRIFLGTYRYYVLHGHLT